jgi:DNA-binding beta-propeller fold protein YncE
MLLTPMLGRAEGGPYRLVENWAQLPQGTSWGVMTAVGVDADGNVYAFQRAEPDSRVIVFDARGRHLKTWGQNQFEYPHGLRVLSDGTLGLTDRKMQQMLRFDRDGKLLMSVGKKDVAGDNDSRDAFNGVSDVVMARSGEMYLTDGEGGNSRVVKLAKDGTFIKSWGTKGSGPGQLSTPHNLALDSRGRVWVCDRGNKRLQIFDADGKYIDQMTQFGTPAAIFITPDDVLYVAASEPENRVTIGTIDGKVLETIEGLNYPHGMAVDRNGALYVAQSFGKAVLKYVRQ